MPRHRMLLGILMESPLYWDLDYDERICLVKEIQERQSFIQAIGGAPFVPVGIPAGELANRFVQP